MPKLTVVGSATTSRMVKDQPIRSGTRNLFANWQIVAVSLLETLVGTYLLAPVGGVVFKPLFEAFTATTSMASKFTLGAFFTSHWAIVSATIVALGVLLLFALIAHSFVTAGNAFVYLAGEAKASAGHGDANEMSVYRSFDFRLWCRAGRSSMWRVAAVHAAAFGIVLLTVGVAVAAIGIGQRIPVGLNCFGVGLSLSLAFAAVLGFTICVPKAVVLVVGGSLQAREALSLACVQSIHRLGDHIWAVIVVGLLTGVASSVVSAANSVATSFVRETLPNDTFVASAQLAVSAAEGLVAIVSTCWLLAIMTALTEMPEVSLP